MSPSRLPTPLVIMVVAICSSAASPRPDRKSDNGLSVDQKSAAASALNGNVLLRARHPGVTCKAIGSCRDLYGSSVEHFIAYGVIRPDRFDCLISRGQALCVDEEDAAGFSRNETLSGIVKFLDFLNNVPALRPKPIYLTVNNIVGPRVSYPKPARIEISKDSGSEDNSVGQEDEGHHEGDYVDHDDGEYKGNNDDGEYKGNNDDGEYKGHSGDDDGEYKGHSDDDDGEYRGHNDEGKGRPQDDHTDQADGRLEAEMRRGGGQVVQRTGDLRKKEKQEKKAKEEEEESSDSDSSESEEEEEED